MKRYLGILLALFFLLGVVGCNQNTAQYTLEEFLESKSEYVDEQYNNTTRGADRLVFQCKDYTMEIYLTYCGLGHYDTRLPERYMELIRGSAEIWDKNGNYYSFYSYKDVLPWLREQH